jgi:hypothetical protein
MLYPLFSAAACWTCAPVSGTGWPASPPDALDALLLRGGMGAGGASRVRTWKGVGGVELDWRGFLTIVKEQKGAGNEIESN